MMANGWIVKWKVKEDYSGQTVSNTVDSLRKIASTAKEFIAGPMAKSTMGIGLKENNMVKVALFTVIK